MSQILVAEDERHIVLLIRRRLEAAGYTVLTTDNGKQALDMALTEPVDLVLLDVMLPGMEGLDVCRQIKAALGQAAPPVIVISARGQQVDVEAGFAAGADDYIIKPFSPRYLLERVQAYVEP